MAAHKIAFVIFLTCVSCWGASGTSTSPLIACSPADIVLVGIIKQLTFDGTEIRDDKRKDISTETEILASLRRRCGDRIRVGEREASAKLADELLGEIEMPSIGNKEETPMEEVMASLLVAGIAYHECGKTKEAIKCYRTIIGSVTDEAGCPALICCTLWCVTLALEEDDWPKEALQASRRARDIAFSLRHDLPELFVICSSIEMLLINKVEGKREAEILREFVKLRRERIGLANAYAFYALSFVESTHESSLSKLAEKASGQSEEVLGASHPATTFLDEMRKRVQTKEYEKRSTK